MGEGEAKSGRPRFGRRRVLRAAVGLGIASAAGIVGLVRSSGYHVPEGQALASLSPWHYVVVLHLARRVCAPDSEGVVTPDETDVAGFVDTYVAQMDPKQRRDLLRFFGYIEQLAPAALGLASRFTRLAPADQDRVLASIEASSVELLRGGFAGVKALLFMGYYRDPRTWSVIGYTGPLVGGAL